MNRRGVAGVFGQLRPSPASQLRDALFSHGEQGALYYFTEGFAGLYQDDRGTLPVTAVGQPVGLMLDRRFDLARGANLVAQSGWTTTGEWDVSTPGVASISSATANVDIRPSENGISNSFKGTTLGKSYVVEFDAEIAAGGRLSYYPLHTSPLNVFGPFSGRVRAIALNTTSYTVLIRAVAGASATVRNWSIRELPGNHAHQTTATARPRLQRDASGFLHLEGDGVDDFMRFSPVAGPQGTAFAACMDWGSVGTTGVVGGSAGTIGLLRGGGALRMYPGGATSGLANNATPRSAIGSLDGETSRCTTEPGGADVSAASAAAFTSTFLLTFGSATTGFAKARIYSAGVIARLLTSQERAMLHSFLNQRAGLR